MSLLTYYQRRTNMSRGQEDGTAKKYVCTWRLEYFCHDGATGLLSSVNEFEDKLIYFSPPAPFPVPVSVVPSTAKAYNGALTRCQQAEQEKKARAEKEKAFKEQLRSGDIYGLRTGEAVAPEPVEAAHLLDDYTVLDLEFQHDPPTLLEVAAIRFKSGEQPKKLEAFVRFFGELDWRVAKLTGITRAQLTQQDNPTEKQVLQALFTLAEGSLLVCHNIGADRTQLEKARTRQGARQPLPNDWLCTLALARKRRGIKAKNGLGELCAEFGIANDGAHRALRDVEMCAAVLRHFQEQQPIGRESLYSEPTKRKAAAQPTLFSAAA